MTDKKTRSIEKLEQRMGEISSDSMRYQVLSNAKEFKTSWIDLGQVLHSVWKDKLYKEWGYQEFESYTTKEIGIKKQTALKLLRSYSFLENEGHQYLKKDNKKEIEAGTLPTYEAIDVLRKASSKKEIAPEDYARIKKYVLEDGKDARDVRKDVTELIRQNEEFSPQEVRRKKRITILKRFINILKSIKKEVSASKLIPSKTIKDVDSLISVLESELS